MAKQHTYSIGPVVGTGRTKTEARADAERKAGDWLGRLTDDGPVVVTAEGHCDVIVPTERGCRVYAIEDGARTRRIRWDDPNLDIGRAVRSLALHMACETWDGSDDAHPDLAWRFGDYERSEWRSWVRFQRRYRAAKDAGFDRHECYNYAHDNPSTPDIIQRVDAALAQPVA